MSSPHPRKAPPVGIAAGAEDAKYQVKYKELKRKVKDIEAENDKLHYRVQHAKLAVRRIQMERAVLYERLSVVPPSPPPRHPHLPPVRTHFPHYPDQQLYQQPPQPPRPVSPAPRRVLPHQRIPYLDRDRDYNPPDPYDDRTRDWDRPRDRDYHHRDYSSAPPPAAPLPSPRAREPYDPPPPRGPDSQGPYYHDYPPPLPPAPRRSSRGATPGSRSASLERDGPPQPYYDPEPARRGSFAPPEYPAAPPPRPSPARDTPAGAAYVPAHADAVPPPGPAPPAEPAATAGRKRTRAEMDMDVDDAHAREYDLYDYPQPHELPPVQGPSGVAGGDGPYGHAQDERGAKRYAGPRSRRSDSARERDDDVRMP